MILAGDIGGTKTYLGLFNQAETKTSPPILAGEIARVGCVPRIILEI